MPVKVVLSVFQAATTALQGLAGASAPELAHLLKSTKDNPALQQLMTQEENGNQLRGHSLQDG